MLCNADVRNSFHHFISMYPHRHILVLNRTFQDNRHLQYYLELISLVYSKIYIPWWNSKKRKICWFLQKNIAHLTHGRALTTLVVASPGVLKTLFGYEKFLRPQFFRTKHVPNEFNNAVVIRRCLCHAS